MSNGAEVGSGHVSIFASMKGFRSSVLKEISASGKEGTSRFSQVFSGTGSKTGGKLGKSLKSSFESGARGIGEKELGKLRREVATSARSMSSAMLKHQDSVGAVKVAQARLNDAVAKYGTESTQAVAASERLASAQRREQAASVSLSDAKGRLKSAQSALNAESAKASGSVQRIRSAFSSLERSAGAAMRSAARTVGSGAVRISDAATGVLRKGLTAAGGIAVAGLGIALAKGFSRLNALDQAKAKLSGLGNSASQVDAILKDSLASVKGTAFGLDEAATVAASAVAAGIQPGQQLQGTLKTVANVAAAAGASMGDMGAIFNKVAASGKADTEDIKQLANQGIPIWQALSKQMGKPVSAVQELASKGKINFDMFQKAAASAAGNVASAMGGTLTGSLKNMWASVGRIGANLEQGIFPKLAPLVKSITNALEPLEGKASSIGELIGSKLSPRIDDLSEKVGRFPGLLDKVFSASGRRDLEKSVGLDRDTVRNVKGAFSSIREGAGTVVDALAGLSRKSGEASGKMPILARAANGMASSLRLVSPILPAVAKLVDLFGTLPENVQAATLGTVLFGGQLRPLMAPIGMVTKGITALVKGTGKAGGAIGRMLSRRVNDSSALVEVSNRLDGVGNSSAAAASSAKSASGKMGAAFSGASIAMGAAGLAISAGLAVVAQDMRNTSRMTGDFSNAMKSGADSVQSFWKSIKNGGDDGKLSWIDKIMSGHQGNGISDLLSRTGVGFDTFKRAVEGSGSAYEEMKQHSENSGGAIITLLGKVKELRGEYIKTIPAMIEYSQTQDAIAKGSGAVRSAFETLGTTLKANGDDLSNNGNLTDASRQAVARATDTLWQNVQAQLEYGKTSGDMSGAIQQAKNSVQEMRDSLISTMESQGASEESANRYADSLGLIPSRIGTDFTADTALSEGMVESYLNTLGLTPEQKKTVMSALTKDADGNIENLHLNMDRLPKRVESILTADDTDAKSKIRGVGKKLGDLGRMQVPSPRLDVDKTQADAKIGQAGSSLQQFGARKGTATADVNDFPARNGIAGATGIVNGFSSVRGTATAGVNNSPAVNGTNAARNVVDAFGNCRADAKLTATDNASGKVHSLLDDLRSIASGAWNATINFLTGKKSGGGEVRRANGGIVSRLAMGGPSGYVRGPGTTTSDSIPTLLSDREYVIRAAAAKKIGISTLDQMNRTGQTPWNGMTGTVIAPNINMQVTTAQTDWRLNARQWGRELRVGLAGGAS